MRRGMWRCLEDAEREEKDWGIRGIYSNYALDLAHYTLPPALLPHLILPFPRLKMHLRPR